MKYRETAGASLVRLVICLYEQAIEDLRRAVIAQERGDIEARNRGINHALSVIAQLQGSRNMECGGEVARDLTRFYNFVRVSLTEAQAQQSARILKRQISQLAIVHEAWLEVECATAAQTPQSNEPAQATATASPSLESPFGGWNA